ncbi:hypothetical protein K0817_014980 [Microbacterium sp. HD4P20]|uniref:hypothetical protein n=1 Tax=Microbacterium sp. HD4P20 TaxID=2864874 RepID=UPI001C63C2A1|nr:hypothetical protein [Microbacterium sp. HD4P20]MCP2637855.1 hypothetical protein [Microbacterium sp. HD4P20]
MRSRRPRTGLSAIYREDTPALEDGEAVAHLVDKARALHPNGDRPMAPADVHDPSLGDRV